MRPARFHGYAASGHIVYGEGGTLRAVRFDQETLEVLGDPVPVVEDVLTDDYTGATGYFDLSDTGDLVYVTGSAGGGNQRTVVWVDQEGREEPLSLPARAYHAPRVSPDGQQIAVTVDQEDLWVYDAVSAAELRLADPPHAFPRGAGSCQAGPPCPSGPLVAHRSPHSGPRSPRPVA